MPPFSGGRLRGRDAVEAVTAEIQRVSALPLPQLAAEVMMKGFGPGGPGGPGTPGSLDAPHMVTYREPAATAHTIAAEFTPALLAQAVMNRNELRTRLTAIIAEGLQLLEHACLIRAESYGSTSSLCYLATRRGRAALERGDIARVLAGDSL
jgi:hypothetical protein